MAKATAEIGIFGGSGFYSFLEDTQEVRVETPYGPPSDKFTIGEIAGRKVAFLPRHGREHQIPAHMVNYRANIYAMRELGVTRILGPCAVGSLQPNVPRESFVICDQFVDRTYGRKDTFYDGPVTTHISTADPYCPELRRIMYDTCRDRSIEVRAEGTVVVIQGPRFSTRSESKWFSSQGWEVINMTQYPEVTLARELEMCYVNVSLVTDYDVGIEGQMDLPPVTAGEIIRILNANNARLKDVIFDVVPKIPTERTCPCATALTYARL
ncbi:MAG TPA: S-methyl-5'-thioadenosine phosphorylase [Chloroflexota bacterium]|nr:S-methyl-5'-thioadenosine phosphorylase [Chloroflexota bacterium]